MPMTIAAKVSATEIACPDAVSGKSVIASCTAVMSPIVGSSRTMPEATRNWGLAMRSSEAAPIDSTVIDIAWMMTM